MDPDKNVMTALADKDQGHFVKVRYRMLGQFRVINFSAHLFDFSKDVGLLLNQLISI